MNVVIVYKWARDPEDALVKADGSVDWRNAKMVPGEDDGAALAVAQELAEAAGAQLVGVTIGDGDASWALARGVTSTVSVTDVPALRDNAATAAAIAAAVTSVGDVAAVVIGDAEQYPGVAPAVAGLLSMPAVLHVDSATQSDGRTVIRRRSGAVIETLSAEGPVLLGVAATAADSRTPGMKELLAARKRPVITKTAADLGVAVTEQLTLASSSVPTSRSARIFTGAPDHAAAELVAALRADGVL